MKSSLNKKRNKTLIVFSILFVMAIIISLLPELLTTNFSLLKAEKILLLFKIIILGMFLLSLTRMIELEKELNSSNKAISRFGKKSQQKLINIRLILVMILVFIFLIEKFNQNIGTLNFVINLIVLFLLLAISLIKIKVKNN